MQDWKKEIKKSLNEWLYAIDKDYLADENTKLPELLATLDEGWLNTTRYQQCASDLIAAINKRTTKKGGFEALLSHYDLSSQEGVVLMCLAEAMLRIPDNETVDSLIVDKLTGADWKTHLGESEFIFVNASTWALVLTGELVRYNSEPKSLLKKMVDRFEAPLLRSAIKQAMAMIAEQFVMGADIGAAIKRASLEPGYRYSYDMLGEAALTANTAEGYQEAYLQAIAEIGEAVDKQQPIHQRTSISVKLSALYPRYEHHKGNIAVEAVASKLLLLAKAAKIQGIGLTVDAEESDRLALSLQVFDSVYRNSLLNGWPGLGLAVQAYQKRALPVLNYLRELSSEVGRKIPVRLVKGAYWDSEIKLAQQQGLSDYPVFTRKQNTDISYLVCAQFLLNSSENLYPQFATHNAYTVAAILQNKGDAEFEFQRLHGMGEALYQALLDGNRLQDRYGNIACRVYAPVGAYRELLPYLVRRLLENGANTSFVNQLARLSSIEPALELHHLFKIPDDWRNPEILLPEAIFGETRQNSTGVNVASSSELSQLEADIGTFHEEVFEAKAIVDGQSLKGKATTVSSPADDQKVVGVSYPMGLENKEVFDSAMSVAAASWKNWSGRAVRERADILRNTADLLESKRAELVYLSIYEAGKTIPDSLAEIREAVDFLRYYADQAEQLMAEPLVMAGVTGESNHLNIQGKGVFLCISPWNFPIAIYAGQIAAALVTGNCVLAKPASLTTLIGANVANLFYQAGVPSGVLHFLPASSEAVSELLLRDNRLAGVAFTGSGSAARAINRQMALREGPIGALIAETGGQNALIADSSAQPEQLVKDVVHSAFNSAGQRCSALRVLYVEDNIADRAIELLKGSVSELLVGKPNSLAIDFGPVISHEAYQQLHRHIQSYSDQGALLHQGCLSGDTGRGYFVAPALIALNSINQLTQEHFGPVLHVIRFKWQDIDKIIEDINATGFGLTFGFHSRIESRVVYLEERVNAGNLYINRDIVGAVVGSQPFGGCGLSGTGPKAGGPHYLLRFVTEQTVTVNTAAVGGNTALINPGG